MEIFSQSILRPGMCLFPGLPVPRTTQAPAACGRAGPRGPYGKIALKPRPPSWLPPFCPARRGYCEKMQIFVVMPCAILCVFEV